MSKASSTLKMHISITYECNCFKHGESYHSSSATFWLRRVEKRLPFGLFTNERVFLATTNLALCGRAVEQLKKWAWVSETPNYIPNSNPSGPKCQENISHHALLRIVWTIETSPPIGSLVPHHTWEPPPYVTLHTGFLCSNHIHIYW